MTAFTTGFRDTQVMAGGVAPDKLAFPVAASTLIKQGALVALNASGYLVEATTSASITVVGRAEFAVDNSTGSNGGATCEVRRGVINLVMSTASSDTPTQANVMGTVYAVDNQTVGILSSGKSVAGKLIYLDPDGVTCWVEMGV